VRGARSSHPTFSSSEMKKDGAQQPPDISLLPLSPSFSPFSLFLFFQKKKRGDAA
jgi:hypothetical protein